MGVKSWSELSTTVYVNIADTQTVICNPSAGSSVTWTPPAVSIAGNDSYWSGTRAYTLGGCCLSLSPSEGLFTNQTNYVAKGVYSNAVGWSGSLSYTIASLFNSSNPTSKTVTATFYAPVNNGNVGAVKQGETFGEYIYAPSNVTLTTVYFTLNAPPAFDTTQVSVDTSYIYSGLTTASVTVSNSSAQYGGTVSDITLTLGNQTASRSSDGTLSILLDTVGTFTPTVTVTDSRGQTTTKSLDPITVNGYVAPSVSFEAERTLVTGKPDDEGTYAVIDTTLTFADVIATAQAPTVTVTDEGGTTTTPTVTWYSTRASDGTLSGTVTWENVSSGDIVHGLVSGFDTQYSYQISVRPQDDKGTGTAIVQTVASAFYTIDFLAGGHGIAFGQPSSQEGFYCNMDAHFADKASVMRALFDFVYPVGSYYETSDTSFNPNTTWGGTWVLETAGQVHVSAGTGYAVSGALSNTTDGGASTVTLDTTMIPAHTHGSKSLSGTFRVMAWTTVTTSGIVTKSNHNANKNPGSGSNEGMCDFTVNATHEHTSVGGGKAHNNMQPYIIVNRWHRTA